MQTSSTRFGLICFIVILTLVLAGRIASAEAAAKLVREIEVEGAARIGAESVLATIPLKKSESYDAARVSQSIKALFATGQYNDVRIAEKNGRVTITLVENPTVAAVSYTGNAEIKSDRFKDVVKLKKGEVYSEARGKTDVLGIRAVYRSEGRLTSEITVQTTPKPGNTVDVVFAIKEGPVNRVSSIMFEGNSAYTSAELEDVITTSRSGWLDILKTSSIYVAERLEEDRDLLWRHYLTHGFADAKVVTAEGTADADGKGYGVRFVVDEGERFTFGDVALDAKAVPIAKDELTPLIKITPGEPYNAAALDKSTEGLMLALWDNGAKTFRVKPEMKRDRTAHRIDVTFLIEEGKGAMIERVDIKGNTKTTIGVILREMRAHEGDPVNSVVLERDKTRIKALGIFKNVAVTWGKGSVPDKAIVTVGVVEDETIVFSVGGGYSSSEGIIGDVAVEDKNLFGTGRYGKIKLTGSLYKLQAEASFTEPHLLGSDLSGGFDLFYKDYDASEFSSFKSRKLGTTVRVGYDISDSWSGTLNYKFSRNTLYDVGLNASPAIRDAIPNFPTATEDTYYTSSIGYALAYDTRNSKKLPTSGNSFVLTQDFAGLGGDVRYVKSTVDARTYFSVSKDVTLVGRATAGNIVGWGGQDVRLLDMYYMGGDLVRGFATAGIGPRDTLSANQDALGGTNYISTTAEARFNLPLVPENIGLRGAVFADAGSLFGTSSSAAKFPGIAGSAATLRASAGVGLIWDSPIGPLRADYAIPLAKQPFDKTQNWSFGIAAF